MQTEKKIFKQVSITLETFHIIFWVFLAKLKTPPEKSWGAQNDPQKTVFFDITSTLLLQHCGKFL